MSCAFIDLRAYVSGIAVTMTRLNRANTGFRAVLVKSMEKLFIQKQRNIDVLPLRPCPIHPTYPREF